jgi:outer membrane protein
MISDRPMQIVRRGALAGLLALAGVAMAQDEAPLAPEFTPVAPLGPTVTALPGQGPVLDLATSLDLARAGNDSLLAERERRGELDGQKLQALSNGMPSIDLTGDWTRRRDPSFALDPTFGGGDDAGFGSVPGADPWFDDWLQGFGSFIPDVQDIPASTYWTTHVSVNWELNPRKILGAVGAANLGIERQDLLVDAAAHDVEARVIDAYYRIILLAEAVRAVEAQYANQRELLNITRLQFELGTATSLDTLQAAVGVANVEPDLRRLRRQVANSGSHLNALLGRDPRTPLAIANEQPIESEPLDRDAAVALALTRPDLRAGDRFVALLGQQRKAQGADRWWPYLTLYGSYGRVGTDFDTQWDDGHEMWTVSAALNLPLFNGLLTSGQVHETKAQIRRVETELRGYRRQAQVQVLELLNNLDAARRTLAAAELNLDRAEEVLAERLLRYRLGESDYLSVLDADTSHLTARRTLIEARYQVLTLTAYLKRAVGHSPATPLTAIPGLVAGVEARG